jgi:hypothetical protein
MCPGAVSISRRDGYLAQFAALVLSSGIAINSAAAGEEISKDMFTFPEDWGGKNELCTAREEAGYSRLWTKASSFHIKRIVYQNKHNACYLAGVWITGPSNIVHFSSPAHFCRLIAAAENPVMLQTAPDHVCGVGLASEDDIRNDRSILKGPEEYRYTLAPFQTVPIPPVPSRSSECSDGAIDVRQGWLHRTYRIVDNVAGSSKERCVVGLINQEFGYEKGEEPEYYSSDISVCRRFEELDRRRERDLRVKVVTPRDSFETYACRVDRILD